MDDEKIESLSNCSVASLSKLKNNVAYDIGSCQLTVAHGDIVKFGADAIVNVTTEDLMVNVNYKEDTMGVGVSAEIHKACGPKLREACLEIKEVAPDIRCPTGEARITDAYDLETAKFIIHTVAPMTAKFDQGKAKELLHSCFASCLRLATDYKLERIAFPLISSGLLGFPAKKDVEVALDSIMLVAKEDYPKEICFILKAKSQYTMFEAEAMKRFDPKRTRSAKKNPFITKGSTFRMNKTQKVMLGLDKKPIASFPDVCEEEEYENSDTDEDEKKV